MDCACKRSEPTRPEQWRQKVHDEE
jgi:hypothetical protein